jgi:hypothetical protein
MEIDELIRGSDPASGEDMPGTWDERWARQLAQLDRYRRRHSARRKLAIAVPLAGGAIIAAALAPQWLDSPPSAATVLDAAATAAASQVPLAPGPGQYLYSVTHSEYEFDIDRPSDVSPVSGSPDTATATWTETKQIWVDGAGAGRSVITASPYRFASAADEAAWHRYLTLPPLPPTSVSTTVGTATTSVASLPTDPATLATEIASGRTGTAADRMKFSENSTFLRTASLLVSQARGMTPALQSSLFRVLAAQPGATVETGVTGESGARGTAVSVTGSSPGQFVGIIIDPQSGAPLEADFAPPSASAQRAERAGSSACTRANVPSCPTGSFSFGPVWTALTAPVVVGSDTSTAPVGG